MQIYKKKKKQEEKSHNENETEKKKPHKQLNHVIALFTIYTKKYCTAPHTKQISQSQIDRRFFLCIKNNVIRFLFCVTTILQKLDNNGKKRK